MIFFDDEALGVFAKADFPLAIFGMRSSSSSPPEGTLQNEGQSMCCTIVSSPFSIATGALGLLQAAFETHLRRLWFDGHACATTVTLKKVNKPV